MTLPNSDRAIVLWNKGQNFFSAFFAEIANIRQAIGDDIVFARWCLNDLRIPLTVITRVSDVLSVIDAAKVKVELASVKAIAQEQKRKERAEREAIVAAERRRKEEERAAVAAEKARQEELKRQQQKTAEKQAQKEASKRKNNAGFRAKQRQEKKAALAKLVDANKNVVPFVQKPPGRTDDELVTQIKAAMNRRDNSRSEWIEASVELAGLLCEARARYPAHQKFSVWLDQRDIRIKPEDRAALLNLGLDLQAMRVILEQTESTSYQLIWRDVKLRIAEK